MSQSVTVRGVTLSCRQSEVYTALACTDETYKEIAFKLGVTEGTLKTSSSRIYLKLGAKNGRISLLLWRAEDNAL